MTRLALCELAVLLGVLVLAHGVGAMSADDRIERHRELVGARVVDVRIKRQGFVEIDLEHRGCDDDACVLLVRAAETGWRYPLPAPQEKT